jgi:hypothetical protein
LLFNFLNKENDTEEWSLLSKNQQNGLLEAIDEFNSGNYFHKTYLEIIF